MVGTGIRIAAVDPRDEPDVRAVVEAAFGSTVEADLVDALRDDPEAWVPELSLGAWVGGALVGHVLFTRADVAGHPAALLAPLAVVPAQQGRGVGLALIREGLARAAAGFELALVLGHPDYYPKAGFVPAAPLGICAPYPIEPPEAWMVVALSGIDLASVRGTVSVARVFDDPALWRE